MLQPLRFVCSLSLSTLLLSFVHPSAAQTSTATWLFPLEDSFTINVIDTVVLQWTSNYDEAWLLMWCQINGPGPNVSLGSEFQVQPNGSFPYIMFSQNPAQRVFPVACHAQLAVEPKGTGVDGPVGITWTSRTGVAAQTFSLARREVVTTSSSTTRSAVETTLSTSVSSRSANPSSLAREISTISSTPTSQSSTSTSSTSSSSPTTPPSSNSNSKTTLKLAIGLSIGLSLVLILFSFSLWYFFLRRSQYFDSTSLNPPSNSSNTKYNDPRYGRHELEDEPRRLHELDTEKIRAGYELDGTEKAMELRAEEARRKRGRSWGGSLYELP